MAARSLCIWLFTSVTKTDMLKHLGGTENNNNIHAKKGRGCNNCRQIKVFVCSYAAVQVSDYAVLLGS